MNIVIDIADMKISNNPEDTLITYSLGSCLGVSAYDPNVPIGGILHCMLPLSKTDTIKAKDNPYMFVDTGLSLFLQTLLANGAKKNSLIVKIAGCSNILDEKKLFNIGERNYTIARKIFWKNDILIAKEHIGDSIPRTLILNMGLGKTLLRINREEMEF